MPNFVNFKNKWQFHPLPVVVIGSYNSKKIPNAMTAAWSTIYDYGQVFVSLDPNHLTSKNILKTKAFTLAFATKKTIVFADYFGIVSGKKINKIKTAKISYHHAKYVNAPIFDIFPLSLECKVISFNEGNLIGKVVNMVVDKTYVDKNNKINTKAMGFVTYNMNNHTYCDLGQNFAKAFKIGKKIK